MNDEDIKKQLEVKNQEIYLNKLNLDLDNNLEVLVLTIDNLLKIQLDELQRKIIEISEGYEYEKNFKDSSIKFMDLYTNNLMNLLQDRKTYIKESLELDNDIEIYKNKLKEIYSNIILNLENKSSLIIKKLEKELVNYLNTDFKIQRLNAYLEYIFLKNLNNKVCDVIRNRDVILINTFNETYLKYLELNKNTIGLK